LAFSFLMNVVTDMGLARAVQDQAATILAWYLNPERPGQSPLPPTPAQPETATP